MREGGGSACVLENSVLEGARGSSSPVVDGTLSYQHAGEGGEERRA